MENQFNQSTFKDTVFNMGDRKTPDKILIAPTASVPATFLGRTKELQDIRALLSTKTTLALVNSEGGMGKTTLAAAYWDQYRDQYKHLAWLFCENGILAAMRAQLPDPLGLQEAMNANAGNPENQAAIIKTQLANLDKDCLLVLDNANDPEHIQGFLQHMNGLGWHVLMTSRCSKVLPDSQNEYPIKSLPPDLAKQLFINNYNENSPAFDALLDRFLEAVGYNTLCIEVFSKNLREGGSWGYTFADFLQQLEKGGLILGENSFDIVTDYALNVRKTTKSSDQIIEALYSFADLKPDETDLLIQFSLLPAENHSPELLLALISNENSRELKRRLDSLAQKGWVATDTQSYRVSPVVQKIVLQKHADRRWALAEPIIKKLHTIFETEGYHSINIATAAPFAAIVFGLVENLDAANNDVAILFDRLWVYYTATGNLAQALDTATRMQVVCEKYDGKNNLAISYEKLGNTHTTLGNLEQALGFYEAYNRLEKELHADFPDNVEFKDGLAISYEKLGTTQTALGNLDQALGFYEEDIKLSKELHTDFPNHVYYKNGLAISYGKLGTTHTALDNLDQALGFYESYNHLEKELHADFPKNVEFKNGLAISYCFLGITHTALGNLDQALGFYESYNHLEAALHADFPKNVEFKNLLAISYSKLGETHTALGNLDQALGFYEVFNRLGQELHADFPNNVEYKKGLAISHLFLGQFFRDNKNDKINAHLHIKQGLMLYEELVRDFPAFVEFKKNFEWVRNAMADLDK